MILQLNPTIPITRNIDNMKGYAMLVIDYSQEHDLLFSCAMDNGEIWTYSNKDIKIQNNISLNRTNDNYVKPLLHTPPKTNLFTPNGTPFGTIPNGTITNDANITFTSLSTGTQNAIIEELKTILNKIKNNNK